MIRVVVTQCTATTAGKDPIVHFHGAAEGPDPISPEENGVSASLRVWQAAMLAATFHPTTIEDAILDAADLIMRARDKTGEEVGE